MIAANARGIIASIDGPSSGAVAADLESGSAAARAGCGSWRPRSHNPGSPHFAGVSAMRHYGRGQIRPARPRLCPRTPYGGRLARMADPIRHQWRPGRFTREDAAALHALRDLLLDPSRITADYPLGFTNDGEGRTFLTCDLPLDPCVWAQLTANAAGVYSWVQVGETPLGWQPLAGGLSGSPGNSPAYEIDGNANVPVGTTAVAHSCRVRMSRGTSARPASSVSASSSALATSAILAAPAARRARRPPRAPPALPIPRHRQRAQVVLTDQGSD